MPRAPLALFLLGLVVHGAWALTVAQPVDWDPAYYRGVAAAIAAGEGAQVGAIWSLAAPPPALPQPADLHWMPGPSRILVPGLLAWPARGDQAVSVLTAATWGPLAWALAGAVDRRGAAGLAAGALAVAGGAYARFLSTPDSIARLNGTLTGRHSSLKSVGNATWYACF